MKSYFHHAMIFCIVTASIHLHKETELMQGALDPTNEPYALAYAYQWFVNNMESARK